jgi:hypothetical protein
MPPLYRMPVFYVAALVLGAAIGLGSWVRARPAASPGAVAQPKAREARDPSESPRAAPADPPVSDGILRTADGLRRKVVVRDLDVVCRTAPEEVRPTGAPLDYFAIRYVYGEAPADHPTMFQVGLRDGTPQGWVSTASVLEWDTRLMARPTPRTGRPALLVYRDESCLLDVLAGRLCPRHQGRCPTEGEEAAEAATPPDSQRTALGMPILQARAIPEPDGSTRTIFEVASLVRDASAPAPPPAQPPADLLPALRQVYVAFVIDTTASMQATIDATRRLAARLADDTARHEVDIQLQLAVVEYRDTSPLFGFTTRLAPFNNPRGFHAALSRLSAAKRGDGTVDEAVLDGVAAALPAAPGEVAGPFDHLSWPTGRTGDLATKLLVLLGDAPDHARDAVRAAALADRARRAGITIATVALDRPGTLSRAEEARFREQWRTLAEGSFHPLDKSSGFTRPVAPSVLRLDQAQELEPLLQALIDDRIAHARNLAALAAAQAESRLTEYVTSQGLTLAQVAPVLVDLHRGEPVPAPRPDPRARGRKAPSLRRGWIAERKDGMPLITVEMLMTRPELGVLIDELTQLQQAAQGTASELTDLLRIGTAAASGETAFLAADRGGQTFADHLRRRQGLPPARPDSLLHRSQTDLLQADDLYRQALDAHLASALAALIRRYHDLDWSDPRRTIEGMGLVSYALIDF